MKQNISLNDTFKFFTDAATLAVYDPETIHERINSEVDWWCDGNFKDLAEVKNGLISLVSLGNDGIYKMRVTTESLTQAERFLRSPTIPLGFAKNAQPNLRARQD